MEVNNGTITLYFAKTTGKLVTKDKYGYVHGFAVAGIDNIFYWAKASIKDNTVIVTCDEVKNPFAVRYAWSDNPGVIDLYNAEGLPAVPFRTDSLPLRTAGKVYSDNPWE